MSDIISVVTNEYEARNRPECASTPIEVFNSFEEFYEWSGIKPVVLYNGVEIGDVMISDFSKFTDGTAIPTAAGYDVMIKIPRIGVKTFKDDKAFTITHQFTKDLNKAGFSYWPFIYGAEHLDSIYVGTYISNLTSNNMYSNANLTVNSGHTLENYRVYAKNRGYRYAQFSYGAYELIASLYILMYGSLNCRTEAGYGMGSYTNTLGGSKTYGMDGGNTGTTGSPVKIFGIEDMWSRYTIWTDGVYSTGANIKICPDNLGFDDTGVSYPTLITNGATTGTGNIAEMSGSNILKFWPTKIGTSPTTGWCARYFYNGAGAPGNTIGLQSDNSDSRGIFTHTTEVRNWSGGHTAARLMAYGWPTDHFVHPNYTLIIPKNSTGTKVLYIDNKNYSAGEVTLNEADVANYSAIIIDQFCKNFLYLNFEIYLMVLGGNAQYKLTIKKNAYYVFGGNSQNSCLYWIYPDYSTTINITHIQNCYIRMITRQSSAGIIKIARADYCRFNDITFSAVDTQSVYALQITEAYNCYFNNISTSRNNNSYGNILISNAAWCYFETLYHYGNSNITNAHNCTFKHVYHSDNSATSYLVTNANNCKFLGWYTTTSKRVFNRATNCVIYWKKYAGYNATNCFFMYNAAGEGATEAEIVTNRSTIYLGANYYGKDTSALKAVLFYPDVIVYPENAPKNSTAVYYAVDVTNINSIPNWEKYRMIVFLFTTLTSVTQTLTLNGQFKCIRKGYNGNITGTAATNRTDIYEEMIPNNIGVLQGFTKTRLGRYHQGALIGDTLTYSSMADLIEKSGLKCWLDIFGRTVSN